jgi:hypothetical protein
MGYGEGMTMGYRVNAAFSDHERIPQLCCGIPYGSAECTRYGAGYRLVSLMNDIGDVCSQEQADYRGAR